MKVKYFKGKNAVITGAASGIGREFAVQLAEMGTNLVISDINEDRLAEVTNKIESTSNVKVLALKCDVTKPTDIRKLAKKSIAEMGEIHFLFSNAGIAVGGPFEHLLISQWERIININMWGTIHIVRAFIPKMLEQEFGHIIVTASIAGTIGVGGLDPYSTSKFANAGFCESIYGEFADKGIEVSILCPFPLKTNLIETVGIGIPPELLEGVDPEAMTKGIEAGKAIYWEKFTKKKSLLSGFGGGFTVERAVKRYLNAIRKKKLYIFERKYGRLFQFIQGLWPALYKALIRNLGRRHTELIQTTFEMAIEVAKKEQKK